MVKHVFSHEEDVDNRESAASLPAKSSSASALLGKDFVLPTVLYTVDAGDLKVVEEFMSKDDTSSDEEDHGGPSGGAGSAGGPRGGRVPQARGRGRGRAGARPARGGPDASGVVTVVAEDGTARLANVRPIDASNREDNPYKHRIQEVSGMDGKRLRRLVVRD
jgi:hypothetical protein